MTMDLPMTLALGKNRERTRMTTPDVRASANSKALCNSGGASL